MIRGIFQAPAADETGEAEQREVILTLGEIGESRTIVHTSASLLQRITTQLKSSLREIKRQIAQRRREPAWNLSNRTDHATLADHMPRKPAFGRSRATKRFAMARPILHPRLHLHLDSVRKLARLVGPPGQMLGRAFRFGDMSRRLSHTIQSPPIGEFFKSPITAAVDGRREFRKAGGRGLLFPRMKLFYTGPVINTEMLVVMLEKHGIAATQSWVDASAPDDGDLSRPAQVFVPEADYDRAYRLFYAEREDEL